MNLHRLTIAILLLACAAQAQERGIIPEEFIKARPAKPATASAKAATYKRVGPGSVQLASLRKNSADTRDLGVTIWRLRPSVATDNGARLLVQEGSETISWTPERVPSGTPLRTSDRVRLSIESPQSGYLYVIDREKYAGNKIGEPHLIFPTTRTHNGDNQVSAGHLIEIPAQDDRPNYFTLRPSQPGQAGEVLTLLVTDKPIEGLTIGPKDLVLSQDQVAAWEKQWSKKVEHFEMAGGNGKTWTKAEQEAGADGTRLLTQDDPGPQTIYQVVGQPGEPILVNVGLNYTAHK
jgi:hypothetical protein